MINGRYPSSGAEFCVCLQRGQTNKTELKMVCIESMLGFRQLEFSRLLKEVKATSKGKTVYVQMTAEGTVIPAASRANASKLCRLRLLIPGCIASGIKSAIGPLPYSTNP